MEERGEKKHTCRREEGIQNFLLVLKGEKSRTPLGQSKKERMGPAEERVG